MNPRQVPPFDWSIHQDLRHLNNIGFENKTTKKVLFTHFLKKIPVTRLPFTTQQNSTRHSRTTRCFVIRRRRETEAQRVQHISSVQNAITKHSLEPSIGQYGHEMTPQLTALRVGGSASPGQTSRAIAC